MNFNVTATMLSQSSLGVAAAQAIRALHRSTTKNAPETAISHRCSTFTRENPYRGTNNETVAIAARLLSLTGYKH